MALPVAREARPYYQAAKQRLEDARLLLDAGRTTGAVYLAGYSVECALKALILIATPAGRRADVIAGFRGAKAHDYDWLKKRYSETGSPQFPAEVTRAFSLVGPWAVDIRYQAASAKYNDAERFFKAVKAILDWADGRM